ncbi:hypothetical protein [Bradyrhizobium cenepequi]|uniref:hypothetical protein n=1 Tax=Bradyrhizobium cenepequi TaxID=2821403 RepID=UPI001CE24797|nr:hypothetical protein [Bradyrhizobium cenepequi]MCA6108562.1 hypothetical protein [Bradyrhizobium cenepequi]
MRDFWGRALAKQNSANSQGASVLFAQSPQKPVSIQSGRVLVSKSPINIPALTVALWPMRFSVNFKVYLRPRLTFVAHFGDLARQPFMRCGCRL